MRLSFGGSDNKLTPFDKARVVVLPVPYGKTVTYRKGTEKGPEAILKASGNIELFDEELGIESYTIGINTQPSLDVNGLDSEGMIDAVEQKVSDICNVNKMPVIIGGEHSVSIGAVKAVKRQYKSEEHTSELQSH